MLRKLIQLSPSTSVVSLPSSWIKANNLKKGTSINLEIKENDVVISSQKTSEKKKIDIDISDLDKKSMWVAIDTAYTTGHDTITIKTRDVEQSAFLTKVVRYFPGMMITSETKNNIQFDAIEDSPMKLDKIIDRIFLLNVSLLEDAIESISLKEWDDLLRIKYRDYTINSYISYCFRSINKFGFSPFSKTGTMHSFIKMLELFSDKLCVLFEEVATKKARSLNKKTLNHLCDAYKKLWQTHTKYSREKIMSLEEERKKIVSLITKEPSYARPALTDLTDLFFALIELEMQLNT